VSIDESDLKNILTLTHAVAPYVCAIKYHSDIWDTANLDNNQLKSFKKALLEIAKSKRFLIFEDRKFADIGSIVQKQYRRIQDNYYDDKTIDLVTVLPCAGRGTIDSILESSNYGVGILLVSQLSTKGNLLDSDFTKKCVQMADQTSQNITGFILQQRTIDMKDDRLVYCTPGVSEYQTNDKLDQQYRTIEDAIVRDKCDIIIVGRSITGDNQPSSVAKLYAEKAYKCYMNECC
jgi:orotidine 5'-phosphate decarboxylase subfamily 1